MSYRGPEETVLAICECHSDDHLVKLEVIRFDELEVDAYLSTQMTPLDSFWKRLKAAFQYLVSPLSCRFGHWQETMLDKESAIAMRDALDVYIKAKP